MCDEKGDEDKNERFASVISGDAKRRPRNVLIWSDNNTCDFPNLSQTSPGEPADFGRRFLVLSNPMYGPWQKSGEMR
jgi:predicted secreted acid phosphatase